MGAKPYLEVGRTYDVNDLVHHENYNVRYEAAAHGYSLDVLVNDENSWVHEEVSDYLKEHGYKSVFEWAKDNGIGIGIGIGIDIDIDINEWLHSDYAIKRKQVVKCGYRLDILVNDKSADVRMAVARQGYSLDILVNDESRWVREAVAKQGYGLDVLIKDKDKNVRGEVNEYLYRYGYKSVKD